MTEEILYEVESMGITVQVVDKKNVRHVRFGNSIRQSSISKAQPFKLQTKYARDMVKVFDYYKKIYALTKSVCQSLDGRVNLESNFNQIQATSERNIYE